jgi:hypothetical protein
MFWFATPPPHGDALGDAGFETPPLFKKGSEIGKAFDAGAGAPDNSLGNGTTPTAGNINARQLVAQITMRLMNLIDCIPAPGKSTIQCDLWAKPAAEQYHTTPPKIDPNQLFLTENMPFFSEKHASDTIIKACYCNTLLGVRKA